MTSSRSGGTPGVVGVLYDSASAGQTVVHHPMILRTIPSHRADARCGGAEGSGDEARECFDAMGVREEEGRRGMRWMPWRQVPKKDVGSCEKHRGAGTAH
jgi:hypothetical protein